jgi:hypothetical protein
MILKIRKIIVTVGLIVISTIIPFIACIPGDKLPDDIYTANIYAGNSGLTVGNQYYPYQAGYFNNIYTWINASGWIKSWGQGAKIYQTSVYTLPCNTWSNPTFQAVAWDTDGCCNGDNQTLHAKTPGVYSVTCELIFDYNPAYPTDLFIGIYQSSLGWVYQDIRYYDYSNWSWLNINLAFTTYMTVDDWVTVGLYQSGVEAGMNSRPGIYSYLGIQRIGG